MVAPKTRSARSTEPFGTTVRRFLDEEGLSIGNLVKRAKLLTDRPKGKSTVTQMMRGNANPSPEVMEMVAKGLHIEPEVFAEYRMWKIRKALNPAQPATNGRGGIGFEAAVGNLIALEQAGVEADLPIPAGVLADRQSGRARGPRRAGSS